MKRQFHGGIGVYTSRLELSQTVIHLDGLAGQNVCRPGQIGFHNCTMPCRASESRDGVDETLPLDSVALPRRRFAWWLRRSLVA